MATTNQVKHHAARKIVTLIVLMVAIVATLLAGHFANDQKLHPELAIDLAGGRQFILTPRTTTGAPVTEDDLDQAIAIIRQRIDASGVAEAEITKQGGANIVVALPGEPSEDTRDLVTKSAQMRFRPVLAISDPAAYDPSELEGDENAAEDPALDAESDEVTVEGDEDAGDAEGDDTTGTDEDTTGSEDNSDEDASADTTDENALGSSQGFRAQAANFRAENAADGDADAADADADADTTDSDAADDGTGEEPTDPIDGLVDDEDSSILDDLGATDGDTSDTSGDAATTDDGPSTLPADDDPIWQTFAALDCTLDSSRVGTNDDDPNAPFATCDPEGTAKYLLGPVEIEGSEIRNASSSLETTQSGQTLNTWQVNMEFTSEGGKQFAEVTGRIAALDTPRNQFGVVLDGLVISAPSVGTEFAGAGIPGGSATITGSKESPFTRESATTLANQMKFGALPLTFDIQSDEQISATLGSEQLEKGLIAGAIGMFLVLIYALVQYRVLGLVVVASLGVAALLAYLFVTLLSWPSVLGLRLSLPAIAGLIVAIGITADSFVVYFERIKDELRDGRPLEAALDTGWSRAKRTILASDAVNLAAAIVLYQLAVGGVKGFAFMLGLTTVIDVILIFWFTHPLMTILAKKRFFYEGHPWSGLDPRKLGVEMVRYRGRGSFSSPKKASKDASADEAEESQAAEPQAKPAKLRTAVAAGASGKGGQLTIAERRALAAKEAADAEATDNGAIDAENGAEDEDSEDGEKQ